MRVKKTKFKGLVVLNGIRHQDKRGYLRELVIEKLIKKKFKFQITSLSKKNVLRGLHFQVKKPQGKLISVSRADVIDNDSLLRNIDNITEAHIDTLDSKNRDELLNTKKVFYYNHTAFSFNFSYEKDKYYFDHLENVIKDCIENDCKNYKPVLQRQEQVRFE